MIAKDAQAEVRGEIERNMIVRRPWVQRGIQVSAARKGDGLQSMQAEVGSRDWFMADQLGEYAVRRGGNKRQFLPYGVRRSIFQVIPARFRPGRLTGAAKSNDGQFFFKRGRGGRSVLYQKMRGDRLRLMYTVGKQQTIKPKASLRDIAEGVARRNGPREFIRQMQAAIKTAR
jgi:hypothetical protein